MLDTNNNAGRSQPVEGDWRSLRLNPYSNDRNLDTIFEIEADPVGDTNRNDLPSAAQNMGALADNLNGGDETLRLGFSVRGTIAAPSDLDVYRFSAVAGSTVWLDIDRTGAALDSVVELISSSGQILAQSDNSFDESLNSTNSLLGKPVFVNATSNFLTQSGRAFPMNQSAFIGATDDFQTINPLDAGMRVVLPGTAGTINNYLVRVRSSNLGPGDPSANLQDTARVGQGLSVGPYRLQVRLQQVDEVAGSTVRYADIRYATIGVDIQGLPGHSPLLGEMAEDDPGRNIDPASAQNLGNLGNSDRSSFSIAGSLNSPNANTPDLDWYRFRVRRDSIQTPGGLPLATVFDLDYADGLGRPDATLWVYRVNANGTTQLVLMGTDSNIADDRAAPGPGNSDFDLSRGSFGPRDPFIGAAELPDGEYLVAVTPSSSVEAQFRQYTLAAPANPNFRLEPISSASRVIEDTFDQRNNFPIDLAGNPIPAQQVGFTGVENAVPFT